MLWFVLQFCDLISLLCSMFPPRKERRLEDWEAFQQDRDTSLKICPALDLERAKAISFAESTNCK